MRYSILLVVLAIFGGVIIAQDNTYNTNDLTGEQITQDIAILRDALTTIHAGYDRYASDDELAEAWARLDALAETGATDIELYSEISYLLGVMRCGHTKAEYPEMLTQFRERNDSFMPFRFRIFDGLMYATSINTNQTQLPINSQIMAINGVAVDEIFESLLPYVAIDGDNDHAKWFDFESDGDLMGSAFEQYYPLLYGMSDTVTLDFIAPDSDMTEQATLDMLTFAQWRNLEWDSSYRADFIDAVTFEFLDDGSGYLRIDTFVNYRRYADAVEKFQPYFEAMREAGTDHLIVDIRQSGGGSDDVALALAMYLIREPMQLMREIRVNTLDFGDSKDYIDTWDPSALNPPEDDYELQDDGTYLLTNTDAYTEFPPLELAFTGDVTMLTSPLNASGATHLLSNLQELDHIRTVGQPTAGSSEGVTAGILFYLVLPNSDITVRVPFYRQYMAVESFVERRGIIPDVAVDLTWDDYLAGIDRTLLVAQEQ